MDVPGPERRLAAVLAADMVGYSRLMEVDEAGTLARLKTHRIELIDPAIAKGRGRIIKTTGDGMLVEFQSVVDAVVCAQIGERLEDVVFEDLGEQNVKNIVRPIRVFRVRLEENVGLPPQGAKDAAAATVSPKKPSIAVLPLANMSGD